MIETVLPAIADAYRPLGVKQVTVQHDGAPPHVGKHSEVLIDEFGAMLDPPIKIMRQPSQSPDTNICDLSFFRALGAQVSKLRDGGAQELSSRRRQRGAPGSGEGGGVAEGGAGEGGARGGTEAGPQRWRRRVPHGAPTPSRGDGPHGCHSAARRGACVIARDV